MSHSRHWRQTALTLSRLAIGTAAVLALPAQGATFSATSATLKAVFAQVSSGDTIILRGEIPKIQLKNRSFTSAVTINASKAVFTGKLMIDDVDNLRIVGGTFGSSTSSWQDGGMAAINNGSYIQFSRPKMIGNGLGASRGINFKNTASASVTNGNFTGLSVAVGVNGVSNSNFSNNRIVDSTSDGFNIVNSHFVTVSGNICSGTRPSAGAHPDCVQLWSLAGQPVQSDIRILNNKAYGATQGFTSFDSARGGGLRIEISNNLANVSYAQGVACYACVDSIFRDNRLITAPGAKHRTNLNIVGGRNNIVEGNTLGLRPSGNTFTYDYLELEAFTGDSMFESSKIGDSPFAAASVPEPEAWLQLLTGFALIGFFSRKRVTKSFG